MGRDNQRGKRGGRGGGRRFAAQSAEEIEQRNARLAAFDADRARRRADSDDDEDGGDDADAQREAMLAGMKGVSVGEDTGGFDQKEKKSKGAEGLIDVSNPNRAGGTNPRMMKASDLGTDAAPMTRKQREEAEKVAKAAAYRKRHEAGLTEEYKHDMAKLAEVRKRREVADAKKKAEVDAVEAEEAERKKKAEEAQFGGEGEEKKKKKKKSKEIDKLDKIAIKKMKPAQMKEALKLRGLDIQGNKNQLTERLVEYEKNR